MKRVAKQGFTLVEILIVVIILGILAAIVIPQFTEASSEARVSNLMTNLQTIRSQLLLYKTQHLEHYPADGDGEGHDEFEAEMCKYTDEDGNTSDTPDSDHPYGPYLTSIPVNPISNSNTVRVVQDADAEFEAPDEDGGWYFNAATGEFRADLTDEHETSDGTKLNEL